MTKGLVRKALPCLLILWFGNEEGHFSWVVGIIV